MARPDDIADARPPDLRWEESAEQADAARYRTLGEASAQVVWAVDPAGCVRDVVPAWCAFTGQTPEEIQGWGWTDALHPRDRRRVQALWRRAVGAQRPFASEYRVRSRAGIYAWFSVHGAPRFAPDGTLLEYVGTAILVEAQKRAVRDLRASEERLRLAFEATRMGMWEYEFQTGHLRMSPRAYALLSTTAEAFDLARWHRLGYVHADDRARVQAAAAPVGEAPVFELTTEHRTRFPEEEERWVRSHSTISRDERGQPHRLIGTLVDITEQKRYEQALEDARDRAEDMVRLRDAFLANMSHEIRTPLVGMLGYVDLLRQETPAALHEYIDAIEQGGTRLLNLLTSVLELSQLQAGLVQPAMKPVRVRALLADTLVPLQARAEERSLSLRLEVASGLPEARVEPVLVERLLARLLDNALKFTEQGAVVLRAARADDALVLRVEDTGPCIPTALLPQLFDAFRQGSQGFGRTHEGAGLGLAVARHLAHVIGGQLAVTSTPGQGTTCEVQVPGVFSARRQRSPRGNEARDRALL